MVELTSKEVARRIEKMSVVGFVLDVLQKNATKRTPENYQEIKEIFHTIPENIPITECKEYIKKIIEYQESIVVIFRKKKNNGKFYRREYREGYFYYSGDSKKSLEKIYVHWGKEKIFLLSNIDSLRIQDNVQVKKLLVECLPYVCVLNFSLMKESHVLGEISIYIGYPKKGNNL